MGIYKYGPYPKGEPQNYAQGNSDKGVKYRIYNIFKPSITLDELSVRAPDSESKTQKIEDSASLRYPLIKINNYFLNEGEIDFMKIDSRDFLPTIILTVTFIHDVFISREFPKDGDIISLAIRNKSDVLNIIRNDYVITGVTVSRKNTILKGNITVTFFGELFVPGLKSFLGTNSQNGTSMDVLKEAAKKLELGFNTNETETKDQQIWYCVDTLLDFIKEITERSWKNENSFFRAWIDIYYNLNFVNVQKQLLSSEDDVDIGAVINNIDKDRNWGSKVEEKYTKETPKVFSNFFGYRTTSFYITHWKPINRSSAITFQYGTSMTASFFEHINSLYKDADSQKYWNIEISPAYDKEKLDKYILLRGRSTYNREINEEELARANYNYTELYKRSPWMGVQYTITNVEEDNTKWTGNMHENYLRAQIHNTINNVEIEKLNVEINVQGTNLNIIKGDKLPIVLIKKDRVENRLINKNAKADAMIDFFYTGWYYVKGYTISWTKKESSIYSNFTQSYILTRREWPTPEPIDPIEKPEKT